MFELCCVLSSVCCLICIIIMRKQIAKLFDIVEKLAVNEMVRKKTRRNKHV